MAVLAIVNMLFLLVGFLSGLRKKGRTLIEEWLEFRQQTKRASSKLTDVV
jgi:hypothetical protein